jgi:ribosomal protein L11 methyltransferase
MIALRVTVRASDEDLAASALWDEGTSGIEIQPGGDGTVGLVAYFEEPPERLAQVERALARIVGARVEPAPVPDLDWVSRFRREFRAFEVGAFRIAPPWDRSDHVGRNLLRIEPGRAFGTGTHETTRLCLRALERLAARRPLGRVLDIGTGSGILAVAAARLGAERVVALDVDPAAVEAAGAAARLNRASILLVRADGAACLAPARFDVVLANLTAPLLVERAREIAARRTPGGGVVLAGLLCEQLGEVREAWSGFGPLDVDEEGEWAALVTAA